MEGDEGEMLWMLGALLWKAFVMIGTSSSCRHLYYHLFIVALGVMRQFIFPSKHINTRNELFMTLLILYEEPEQTVWTKKNIRFRASERKQREEEQKLLLFYFHSGLPVAMPFQ